MTIISKLVLSPLCLLSRELEPCHWLNPKESSDHVTGEHKQADIKQLHHLITGEPYSGRFGMSSRVLRLHFAIGWQRRQLRIFHKRSPELSLCVIQRMDGGYLLRQRGRVLPRLLCRLCGREK